MKNVILVLLVLTTLSLSQSCNKDGKGCMDPKSLNFDPNAVIDDGSCKYPEESIIDEDINTNTVINKKVIKICGNINVNAGLVIPEGTTVIMCAESSLIVKAGGYLKAVGTANEPIVIKGESNYAGFWAGIKIASKSPNNIFSHTTISDAGSYWAYEYAGIFVEGKLSMDNTVIDNNEQLGIWFGDGANIGTFVNNTISNNQVGMSIQGSLLGKLDEETKYTNNTNNYIYVRNSNIEQNTTWAKMSVPLLVEQIDILSGLTIAPGNKLLMRSGYYGIRVKDGGYFNCSGTVTNPISIVGEESGVGYWEGITITTNSPKNIFNYTTISDAGAYWYYEYSSIFLLGKVSIDNSTISNSESYGIYNDGQITTSGKIVATVGDIKTNNTFVNNGTGANSDCTGDCSVNFK